MATSAAVANGASFVDAFAHFQLDPNAHLVQSIAAFNDIGIVLTSLFVGSLLPVTVTFVLFSTPASRTRLMFYVQSLMIACAYAESLLYLIQSALGTRTLSILTDTANYVRLSRADAALRPFVTLLADVTLLLKVLDFFPSTLFSSTRRLFVVSLSVVLKVGRLSTMIALAVVSARSAYLVDSLIFFLLINVFEIVDNCFMSAMLLHQSYKLYRIRTRFRSTTSKARLQYLIESIFLTFVPAVLVQLISLGLLSSGPILITHHAWAADEPPPGMSDSDPDYFARVNAGFWENAVNNQIILAWLASTQLNVMFSVHFSLLATTWTTLRETRSAIQSTSQTSAPPSDHGLCDKDGGPELAKSPPQPHHLHGEEQGRQRTVLSLITDSEPIEVLMSLPDDDDPRADERWTGTRHLRTHSAFRVRA